MNRTRQSKPLRATRRQVLRTAAAGGALAATSPFWFHATRADAPIKIGFSMALTGGLAGAGKPALIAMEIWRDDVNANGGLLGRQVEFVYYDDQTQPANVPKIYTKLLNVDGVDLVVSGYGTNLIAPAMPVVMRKKMVFMSLFGLAANEQFNYDNYFQIMPAGPEPKEDWSRGFIQLAKSKQLQSIALVGADAEFSKNAVAGARSNAKEAGLADRLRQVLSAEHDRLQPDRPRAPGDQSRHRLRRVLSAGFGRHGARGP